MHEQSTLLPRNGIWSIADEEVHAIVSDRNARLAILICFKVKQNLAFEIQHYSHDTSVTEDLEELV